MHISFVIPAYNAAGMLPDAVDSIFDGNFTEGDEVIIVDDASRDGTLAIANKLAERYGSMIKVVSNAQNKGCPASRNVGIALATNPLIFNLDADNVLAPASIAALRAAIESEKADVAAFGEYRYFKDTTDKVTHRWICKPGVFTLADFFAGIINQGPGGNYLYRKALWEHVGHYWEYGKGLHEAWGYTLKILINGAKFVVVPDTFYFHRYSHQSLFVRESKKANEEFSITSKFILPALPLFNLKSRAYVAKNPDWYSRLGSHPLRLVDGSRGTDGKLVYSSPIKQAAHRVRSLFKKRL